MKTFVAMLITAAVTALAAFILVYLPERGRLVDAQAALTGAEAGLADARALLTVHALHDEVLDLLEQAQDPAAHERAMSLSTRFFDLVRAEVTRTGSEEVKAALTDVLARRDAVTAALARRDPVVRAALDEIRKTLHPLLRAPKVESAPALSAPPAPPAPGASAEGAAAPTGPSR